jgi:transcription elongation factor Elf1
MIHLNLSTCLLPGRTISSVDITNNNNAPNLDSCGLRFCIVVTTGSTSITVT